MTVFFLNYKDELKRLITAEYAPADTLSKEFQYTTEAITDLFLQVLPNGSIDEHDVYEVLLELGFQPKENPKKPLEYFWYFKRK